ncbi:MAG: hypothetical protein P8O03_05550 [Ilumatobacter sp.]|nr:hypothetical protein [Ilumatobacter sp.]
MEEKYDSRCKADLEERADSRFKTIEALNTEFPNLSGNDALILLEVLTDRVSYHREEGVKHHNFAKSISDNVDGGPESYYRRAATESAIKASKAALSYQRKVSL